MRKNTMLGLGAALLVIISTFLTLITVAGVSATVWTLREDTTVGIVLLVIAGLMGVFSLLANKKNLASIGTLIMSAILVCIAMIWAGDAKEQGATMGIGLILLIVGSVLGFISSIMGFMKK